MPRTGHPHRGVTALVALNVTAFVVTLIGPGPWIWSIISGCCAAAGIFAYTLLWRAARHQTATTSTTVDGSPSQ